jgi:hypothetical protein
VAEFVARLGIVGEEADESLFWLEFIDDAKLLESPVLQAQKERGPRTGCDIFGVNRTARRNARHLKA